MRNFGLSDCSFLLLFIFLLLFSSFILFYFILNFVSFANSSVADASGKPVPAIHKSC